MTFKVLFSPKFNEKFRKLDHVVQSWIMKMVKNIVNNPNQEKVLHSSGCVKKNLKILCLFHIIYFEEYVYFVDISVKKDQKIVIAGIFRLTNEFYEEVRTRLSNETTEHESRDHS